MSISHVRARAALAPVLIGLFALVAACAPPPPPPGIYFFPPSVGYVNRNFTPSATASNNLPVSFELDESSTGCSLTDGVVTFETVGNCVITASQTGPDALPAVQRTIPIYECPALRGGVWTGPQGLSANVTVAGNLFSGTVDLSSLGYGVQIFSGSVDCEIVHMMFNTTPLTGVLSPDGMTLSGSYQGISVVLHAPQP